MTNDVQNETVVTATKNEVRLKAFSNKIKDWFNSDWSFILFIIFFSVVSTIQIIFDAVNGNLIGNAQLAIDLTIWGSSISMICATILSARLKTKFFIFSLISLSLTIIRSILVGLLLSALKLIILFIPIIIRFLRWSKGAKENKEIKIKRIKSYSFVLTIILLAAGTYFVGWLMSNIDFEELPYVDAGNFVFSLGAASLVAFGYLEGWLLTMISLSFIVASYVLLATNDVTTFSISGITATITFMILNLGTFFAWLSLYHTKNHTFKYIKIKPNAI